MAIDLVAIRVMLTGGSQVAAETKGINSSLASTGAAAEAAGARTSSSMKKVSKSFRNTGKKLTTYVTLPLVALAAYGIKTAASFGESMNQVRVAGGVGGKGMIELESLAKKMGRETVFSSNDAAEAMLSMIKGGITPAQIRAGALSSAMNLAATEGIDLARSGEIITQSMKGFHISADESVRVADAFAGGSIASTASVEGLTQSLAQTGPGAASMGLSIEETIGTLASFSDHMIKGSDAGTSLKTFLASLVGRSEKSRKAIDNLGLSFFDANGNMKKLPEIADELRKHLGKLTDEELKREENTIFGQDASRAATALMEEGSKGLGKYIEATREQGAAEKLAKARMKGLAGVIERLKGSFETMALAVGELLAPIFEDIAGVVEDLMNKFSELPKPTQEIILKIGGILAVAGPLLIVLGSLAGAFVSLAAAVALVANPVTLTLGAVLLMAAAFYIAYHKIKPFRDIVDFIVGLLGGAANAVAYFLFAFSPLAAVATFVIANLDHIRDAINWVTNAAKDLWHFFTETPLGQILAGPFTFARKAVEFLTGHAKDFLSVLEDIYGIGQDIVGAAEALPGVLSSPVEGSPTAPSATGPHGGAIPSGPSPLKPGLDTGGGNPGKHRGGAPGRHSRPGTAGASVAMPHGRATTSTLIEVPVNLDGKEVARLVARHNADAKARL